MIYIYIYIYKYNIYVYHIPIDIPFYPLFDHACEHPWLQPIFLHGAIPLVGLAKIMKVAIAFANLDQVRSSQIILNPDHPHDFLHAFA